ncbi:hypothetical protein DSECCO2_620370 [anaerobic digester metagenome]|nr:hypothetical protein [Lentimicrobiaceae bacterium]
MDKKYLYGASVQGIQGFIFQTQALREIAGGSELVEQICTTKFAEAIGKDFQQLEQDQNAIITAAGNIKYVFDDKDKCASVVMSFPKIIMEMAPGITLSQAVVEIENFVQQKDIDLLEERLKTQRNMPFNPISFGTMGILKSRKTGLPVVENFKGAYIDQSQQQKRKSAQDTRIGKLFFGDSFKIEKMPFDLHDITQSKGKNYSWLAIVHADGNNMGQMIQKMAAELSAQGKRENYALTLRKFSLLIDKATKEAAAEAYSLLMEKVELDSKYKFPFRPVIIGGDDLTVICRADLALPFSTSFLKLFAEKSKEYLQELNLSSVKGGITACAGIAFIKESYPFHYGYQLAEILCSHAKKEAKTRFIKQALTPSCLMFHKVLDSYVEDFKDITERELTIDYSRSTRARNDILNEVPEVEEILRFDYGPYYLDQQPSVETFNKNVQILGSEEGKSIKSSFREWLTLLQNNKAMAHQKLNRMISVGQKGVFRKIGIDNANQAIHSNHKTPVYDWLTIVSINEGGN